ISAPANPRRKCGSTPCPLGGVGSLLKDAGAKHRPVRTEGGTGGVTSKDREALDDSSAASAGLKLIVVTGLSGAGKSTVLNALEDLGYLCVDNLPPPVLGQTLDALLTAG